MSTYNTKDYAIIRAMYESGEFRSLKAVQEHCKKAWKKKPPSMSTLEKMADREGWKKTAHKEDVQEVQHEKFKRLFEEVGLTEKVLVKSIHEMITSDTMYVRDKGIQRYIELTGTRAPQKTAITDDQGKSIENTIFVVPANGFEPTQPA